jgi:hypothetical protein
MVEHRHVEWDPDTRCILTSRLLLRPWQLDDDLAAYGLGDAPDLTRVKQRWGDDSSPRRAAG